MSETTKVPTTIDEIRATGARIKFITDGDVAGGISAARPNSGVDLLLGVGGTPEGIITACAMKCLDGVIQVDAEPAREMARRAAREEGILVGISSGATLAAIAQKLPELPAGTTVLGFNYDTGERYLSIEGFLPT